MASSGATGMFGQYNQYFAVFGKIAFSYLALRLSLSIVSLFKKLISTGVDWKKYGKWAVVTGCTDGIGKEYALQLAQRGKNIVLISRSLEKLKDVASEIETKYKVETKIIVADFSEGKSIYPSIEDKLVGLDIGVLVNNVGISYEFPALLHELPDVDTRIAQLIEVNMTSATMMTRLVINGMLEKKRGIIINISSGSGARPTALLTVYSAAKAYIDFLSRALNQEYSSKGIIVQSVLPYFVTTKLSKIKKASLLIPNPKNYVTSALSSVGVTNRTYGFWSHRLMGWVFDTLPACLVEKISWSQLNGPRRYYLKKRMSKKE